MSTQKSKRTVAVENRSVWIRDSKQPSLIILGQLDREAKLCFRVCLSDALKDFVRFEVLENDIVKPALMKQTRPETVACDDGLAVEKQSSRRKSQAIHRCASPSSLQKRICRLVRYRWQIAHVGRNLQSTNCGDDMVELWH